MRPVEFGTRTLKEATSEAIRDWIDERRDTHYLIGSCVGPAPYPEIVRELQAVIGREARAQFLEAEGRLPEVVVACVGGGSNAIGMFAGFVDDEEVRLVGVEAAGAASLGTRPRRACSTARARRSWPTTDGQIADAHSISAGLDYPGVGPEHAAPARRGARDYLTATDDEALDAFRRLARPRASSPRSSPRTRSRARATLDERARPRLPLRPRRQGPRPSSTSRAEEARRLPHGRAGDARSSPRPRSRPAPT